MDTEIKYIQPEPGDVGPKAFAIDRGVPGERKMVFHDRVEIGRYRPGRSVTPGRILIRDATISERHCVVTQRSDGRCFVRDTSRNGTRVEGRRLVPNTEVEILPGQSLLLGGSVELVLVEERVEFSGPDRTSSTTLAMRVEAMEVTVLVGDLHGYTRLVQEAPGHELQESISRVFSRLGEVIQRNGGMVKEYQGDAIFAYWDSGPNPEHAIDACRAALELRDLLPKLADDPDVWKVPDQQLGMDWALASGDVLMESMSGADPLGLSMVGKPVVLAFRLEKLVDREADRIVVGESTWTMVRRRFLFSAGRAADLDGFSSPESYFSLIGPAPGER